MTMTAEASVCAHCGRAPSFPPEDFAFDECALCGCPHFYLRRDFNSALGCVVMLAAIALVPWTYGLSLPVACLFDWMLYRCVAQLAVCYRCGAEYRGWALPPTIGEFSHHTAVSYDE